MAYRAQTLKTYGWHIRRFITWMNNQDATAGHCTPQVFNRYLKHVSNERTWSAASLRLSVSAIQWFYDIWIEDGISDDAIFSVFDVCSNEKSIKTDYRAMHDSLKGEKTPELNPVRVWMAGTKTRNSRHVLSRGGHDKKLPVALNETESQRFLEYISFFDAFDQLDSLSFEQLRQFALLWVLYVTGMRRDEVIRLRLTDLDDGSSCNQNKKNEQQYQEGQKGNLASLQPVSVHIVVMGKGGKERRIPIADEFMKKLNYFKHRRAQWLCATRHQGSAITTNHAENLPVAMQDWPLFCNRFGTPYSASGVYALMLRTMQSCEITKSKMGPHVLRHTFATRQLTQGIPPGVVKLWMGHGDLRILFSHYEHIINTPKNMTVV